MHRTPKLRSSCDACGDVKLKCDRGQPECGRCRSLELVCVYSVSRKNGKPPRKRLQVGDARLGCVANVSTEQGTMVEDGENGTSAVNPPADTVMTGLDTFDFLDPFQSDHFTPLSLLPDFSALEFADILEQSVEAAPIPLLDAPPLETFTTSARTSDASRTQNPEGISDFLESASLFFGDNTTAPGMDKESHDCFREAHDILTCLAYHHATQLPSTTPSPSTTADATSSQARDILPLDHMLRSNREAIDRLSRLIFCPCGTSHPYLSLLYAAIISRVLSLYQKAATHAVANTDSNATAFHSMAAEQVPSHNRSHSLASGIGSPPSSSSTSNITASSVFNGSGNITATNHTTHNGPNRTSRLVVAPTKISLGTFDVDDMRVQTTLKIQLISSEIRRARRLVDHFRRDQDFQGGECAFGGRESMYQGLENWLRAEYARVANCVSNQLRELNAY